jgi:hypothetical protein
MSALDHDPQRGVQELIDELVSATMNARSPAATSCTTTGRWSARPWPRAA